VIWKTIQRWIKKKLISKYGHEYFVLGKEHENIVSPKLSTLKIGDKAIMQLNNNRSVKVKMWQTTHGREGKVLYIFRIMNE
jgi:hypothetical protein